MHDELVTKARQQKRRPVSWPPWIPHKNKALKVIAEMIMDQEPTILEANDHDIDAGGRPV